MLNALFLILGILIACLAMQKPIKIEIHHKNEAIISTTKDFDLDNLEQKMLTEDIAKEKSYEDLENINNVLAEARNIMGGSDR